MRARRGGQTRVALLSACVLFGSAWFCGAEESGVGPGALSLPSGPGSVSGLGGNFEASLSSGVGSYGIGVNVPPGVNGLAPGVGLSYSSAGGNGMCGLGWSLSCDYVQLSVEDGLPAYTSADTYIASSGEDLVRIYDDARWPDRQFFLQRREGVLTRFELKSGAAPDGQDYWEAVARDGTRYVYGKNAAARVSDPANPAHIFRWMLESAVDPFGNRMDYLFFQDGNQPYLQEIRYAYQDPAATVYNSVHFVYDNTLQAEEQRPDVLSDFRTTFEVVTRYRLLSVETRCNGQRITKYVLDYSDSAPLSLLQSVTQYSTLDCEWLPPEEFTYTTLGDAQGVLHEMTSPPPVGLAGGNVELLDLNADAFPDIIWTDTGSKHRYWLNTDGESWAWTSFTHLLTGDANALAMQLSAASVSLADLDGDSRTDLFYKLAGGTHDYHFRLFGLEPGAGLTGVPQWKANVDCAEPIPNFAIDNANTRLTDLNADGRLDAMGTWASGYVSYWINEGIGDDAKLHWTPGAGFYLREANLIADNPTFSGGARLVDVNGDGLQDIVTMGSGYFYWWPNRGWQGGASGTQNFGAKREIGRRLQVPSDMYSALRLGDINADGMTDILLLDYGTLYYWINQGERWSDSNPATTSRSDPYSISIPGFDFGEEIRLADMNANGSTDICFVTYESFRYFDLTGGVRPNLLKTTENNLGRKTTIEYRSSSAYCVADRGTDAEWDMTLPFPVQVVSRTILEDGVNHVADDGAGRDTRVVTEYYYHDGYYDAEEKQFRGFGSAEKRELGDDWLPTRVDWYEYDVGDTDDDLRGTIKSMTVTDADGYVFSHKATAYEVRTLLDGATTPISTSADEKVVVACPTKIENWTVEGAWQRQADGTFTDVTGAAEPAYSYTTMAYDAWANATETVSYGLVVDGDVSAGNDEVYSYAEVANATDAGHWRLGVATSVYQREAPGGEYIGRKRFYYDGEDFEGLPLGEFDRGLLKRTEVWDKDRAKWVQANRLAHDAYGNVTATLDALDRRNETVYDDVFHILPVESRVYGEDKVFVTSVEYDPVLWTVTRSTDLNGNVTEYRYDNWGRSTAVIAPGDSEAYPSIEYEYHIDNPISWTETRAREEYGQPGTLDSRTYYNGLGTPLQSKVECENAPDGSTRYIISGLALFSRRGLARRTFLPDFTDTWNYEAPSSLNLDARNHSDVYHDALGRNIRIEPFGADKTPTTTAYRPSEIEVWDAEDNTAGGAHEATPTVKRYDGLGRPVEMVEHNGGETYRSIYEYDARGNMTLFTDALGNETRVAYDFMGRKTELDDPDTGVSTFVYDDIGRLVSATDALGQTKTFDYDDFDRTVRVDYSTTPGEPNDIEYHFDEPSPYLPHARNLKGRLSWVKDATGARFFSYDERGRADAGGRDLLGTVYLSRTEFDAAGRPVSLTYPDRASVEYVYGKGGMLEGIPGYLDDIVYQANGQIDSLTYHNGVTHEYGYDDRLRLRTVQSTTNEGSGTRIQDLEYAFDRTNNITGVTDHRFDGEATQPPQSHTQTFVYDDLYRLTHATGAYGTLDHTYDAVGNILARASTDAAVNLGTYTYGTRRDTGLAGPHAVLSAGQWNFEYDEAGSMTQRKLKSSGAVVGQYEYDIEGRLTRVVSADGTVTENLYDSGGSRVRKRVTPPGLATKETLYIASGYEIDDGVASRYVFGASRRIARVYNATGPPSDSVICYQLSGVLGEPLENEYVPPRPRGDVLKGFAACLPLLLVPLVLLLMQFGRRLVFASRSAWRVLRLKPGYCATAFLLILTLLLNPHAAGLDTWKLPDDKSAPEPGTYYYHPDHLGSSQIITDASGNVVEEAAYRPYGSIRYHTGPDTARYTFTGQEFDADAGLYHLGARFYDAILGRFISADSLVPGTHNPQNFNRYAYVNNNPIRYSDPSGHGFFEDLGDAFGTFMEEVFVPVAKVAVPIIVGAVVTAFFGPVAGGFAAGFTSGLLNGQDLETSLKLGVIGAVSGGVTAGVGGVVAGATQSAFVGSVAGAFAGNVAGAIAGSAIFGSEINWKQVMLATAAASLGAAVGGNGASVGKSIASGGASAGLTLITGGSVKEALVQGVGVGVGSGIGGKLSEEIRYSRESNMRARMSPNPKTQGPLNPDRARIDKDISNVKALEYSQSSSGKQIVQILDSLNAKGRISYDDSLVEKGWAGYYDSENDRIVLNPALDDNTQMQTLIHEAVHARQNYAGDNVYSMVDEFEAYNEEVIAGIADPYSMIELIISPTYGGFEGQTWNNIQYDKNPFLWGSAFGLR